MPMRSSSLLNSTRSTSILSDASATIVNIPVRFSGIVKETVGLRLSLEDNVSKF
jgi:hypothetical protein